MFYRCTHEKISRYSSLGLFLIDGRVSWGETADADRVFASMAYLINAGQDQE